MNVTYRPGVRSGKVVGPSPNEGKILRAMQEAGLFGAEGWAEVPYIVEVCARRPWCRGEMHWSGRKYLWHRNTFRSHLQRLIEKGWVEYKYGKRDGHRIVLFRVKPSRGRPLYEAVGIEPSGHP